MQINLSTHNQVSDSRFSLMDWRSRSGRERQCGFPRQKADVEFRVLSLATFLCFTTVPQTALLAVVMKRHDMPLAEIGGVISV